MDAGQAWQSVLMQLQLDMSRASFETWVRETQAIALQDGVLTVSTPDAIARDWLESRLASTVQRLLIGILNQSVAVQFVVAEMPSEDPESDDDESEEQELAIESVQWLDYDRVVQPQRQVVVKGYLWRLGAEIGPKAIWLYIGFHQAAWMAHDAGSGTGAVLRSREVRRFSGLSNGAFWRALQQGAIQEHLRGLVQRMDPPAAPRYRRGRDGRPHRVPVRYQVFMTPRLTIADAQALHQCLKRSLQEGANIEQALEQCLAVEDILRLLDEHKERRDAMQFHTAMDIAREVNKGPLSATAGKLAQEVHRRIVNALGDIHITHYFITHAIHQHGLTPAQAWLVTVARDMAYINTRTGERREVVTFQNGFQEMAGLLGSKRPKTVQTWFSPDWASHRWGGNLGQFLWELEAPAANDYADLRAQTMPRTFHVVLDEPLDADGTNRLGANGSNRLDANGGNRLDANGSNMVDANGTVKNSFKHPLNTERESTSNTARAKAAEAAPASWDLGRLLEQNQVHPSVQQQLLDAGASAQALVSWILFAASDGGRWISDPLGHAISRLRAEPTKGAGDAFDQLAALAPRRLMALIDDALEDRLGTRSQHEHLWQQTMSSNVRWLSTIRDILFGKRGTE